VPQVVAVLFQVIERVFDVPPHAPALGNEVVVRIVDGHVGDVGEGVFLCFPRGGVHGGFFAFHHREFKAAVADTVDPTETLFCAFALAGKETPPALPCTSREQPHFFVHARQAAVFESNDKPPPVVPAYPEKTLVGVQPIGQNDQGEPRVHLFQFHRQAFESVELAILFVVFLAVFVPHPFRRYRNRHPVAGDQFGFQNVMEISRFAVLGCFAGAFPAVIDPVTCHACPVDGNKILLAHKTELVEYFLFYQCFYQKAFQVFKFAFAQQTVQVFHRVHAREPELEGPPVVFPEPGFPAVVVESVPAALFENGQHDAAHHKFGQRIILALARVAQAHDFFFQPRKNRPDGFGNLVSHLFALALFFCIFSLRDIWLSDLK